MHTEHGLSQHAEDFFLVGNQYISKAGVPCNRD